MRTILRRPHALDWYMLGSWNITAGQSLTVETSSGRDYTKGEILLCTPFAHNRFQSSIFAPKYSVESYNMKIRLSWMNGASTYCYVDVEKVDETHFKLTANENVPGDCQILMFTLAQYGAY